MQENTQTVWQVRFDLDRRCLPEDNYYPSLRDRCIKIDDSFRKTTRQ